MDRMLYNQLQTMTFGAYMYHLFLFITCNCLLFTETHFILLGERWLLLGIYMLLANVLLINLLIAMFR